MAILPREPLKFERQDCTRCGGSGRYSFNLMDGDRCFGCNGKGVTLTKRGAAASKFLIDLRSVPLKDLVPGDVISGMSYKRLTVRVIETRPDGALFISNGLQNGKGMGLQAGPDFKVQIFPKTEEQRLAWLHAALAYEATLDKNGKPLTQGRGA